MQIEEGHILAIVLLGKSFEIVIDKDPVAYVGIQIARNRVDGTILLHQEDSVRKLIIAIWT